MSHPTRGAWIEIFWQQLACVYRICRTLPGVRGLKCDESDPAPPNAEGRTLPGVRGLKYIFVRRRSLGP